LALAKDVTATEEGGSSNAGASGQGRTFTMLMWAFVLAPSPFYFCFSGCLGPQIVLPFGLVWVPFLTLFSLLFPRTWFWHLVFMVPYLAIFAPLSAWLRARIRRRGLRYGLLVPMYVVYWFGIAELWFQIPGPTRQSLLGQQP